MNNEELPSLTLSSKKRIQFIFTSLCISYCKYKNLILWFCRYSSMIYSSCDWTSQALYYNLNTLRTGTASFFFSFVFVFCPLPPGLPSYLPPYHTLQPVTETLFEFLRHTANSHLYLFYIRCCKFLCYCLHASPLLPPCP